MNVGLVPSLVGDGRGVDKAALGRHRLPRHLLDLMATHVTLLAAVVIDAAMLLFI